VQCGHDITQGGNLVSCRSRRYPRDVDAKVERVDTGPDCHRRQLLAERGAVVGGHQLLALPVRLCACAPRDA